MSILERIIVAMGGRKAVLTLTVLAIGASVDLLTVRGLSANLLTLLISAGGLFTVGNVAATAAHSMVLKQTKQEAGAEPAAESGKELQAISNRIGLLSTSVTKTNDLLTQLTQFLVNKQ